ncbi:daunorubicin resistance protein DrrA family ABC transporter ATP-binding protein [Clostridia bacterium]|nr:daunorubicin resistance protein DrrA family ABC transporter ATP-binding protein [Clostridia bacterium]
MKDSNQLDGLAIEANGLVKTFKDNKAVDGIDLRVEAGTIYGILGPNGAGKTTTINMLATLMKPDAGEAKIFGYDVFKQPQIVRSLIGVTGQYASVDENLTATENLVIFARLLGLSRSAAKAKAADLLEEFGLTEAASRPLAKFSGGMRRRLDLAASLIAQPPLIFLDEPTTGLDPRTRNQMWATIRRMVKTGSTILLTTQYLDEADQLADRIAVIDHGRVVAEDTPDNLKISIGKESLMIKLKNKDEASVAIRVMKEFLGITARMIADDSINAPLETPDQAADVLTNLRAKSISIVEINLQKPTLDEVFLTLTGEAA